MAFCIKCGVELSDTEESCPLCNTIVFHPDIKRAQPKPLYPPTEVFSETPMNKSGTLFILTTLCIIAVVVTLLSNFSINGGLTWSHYVWSGIVMLYIIVVLPIWFRRPNPVIFVATDYAALTLYLWFICYLTGGTWFLTFALPVVGLNAILVITMIVLIRYVRHGILYILGGGLIVSGIFMLLTEYLINYTFEIREPFRLIWSVYPFAAFFIIGVALIIIAINRPLRESLRKKFFV